MMERQRQQVMVRREPDHLRADQRTTREIEFRLFKRGETFREPRRLLIGADVR